MSTEPKTARSANMHTVDGIGPVVVADGFELAAGLRIAGQLVVRPTAAAGSLGAGPGRDLVTQ